jgi:soluble lytic murein transglycosylase-like protein
MMFLNCLVGALLLGAGLSAPASADIYAYTDAAGAVSLSNVPTDARYTLLVEEPSPVAVNAPPDAAALRAADGLHAKDGYARVIDEVSRIHGLERALLHAVVAVESRYNPNAVSRKGAAGLMQLMPHTARRYGVADSFDPRQNLDGGARYLKDLLRRFDNDLRLALAAYNAGEHAVARHGNRIPPYRETLRYVPRVLDFYQRYQAGR